MMDDIRKTFKQIMAAGFSSIIYIVWLYALGWLLMEGRYRAFIQPKFSWLLLLGAAILLLYLLSHLLRPLPENKIRTSIGGLARAGILSLPLIFLYAIYGQGLGAHALANKSVSGADVMAIPGLSAKDSKLETKPGEPISLLTLVRHMEKLEGKQVIVEGMIYQDAVMPSGSFLLFRFGIYCCAADAIPVWVIVQGDNPLSLPNESWARVEGRLHVQPHLQKNYPVILTAKVKELPTPAPGGQYLFF